MTFNNWDFSYNYLILVAESHRSTIKKFYGIAISLLPIYSTKPHKACYRWFITIFRRLFSSPGLLRVFFLISAMTSRFKNLCWLAVKLFQDQHVPLTRLREHFVGEHLATLLVFIVLVIPCIRYIDQKLKTFLCEKVQILIIFWWKATFCISQLKTIDAVPVNELIRSVQSFDLYVPVIIWDLKPRWQPLNKVTYNHVHNILRLFDSWANFPFIINETKRDY